MLPVGDMANKTGEGMIGMSRLTDVPQILQESRPKVVPAIGHGTPGVRFFQERNYIPHSAT